MSIRHALRCCQVGRVRPPNARSGPTRRPPHQPAVAEQQVQGILPDLLDTEAAEQYEQCCYEYHQIGECSPLCPWCPGGRWAA